VLAPVPPWLTLKSLVRSVVLLRSTALVDKTPEPLVWTIPTELRPLKVIVPDEVRPVRLVRVPLMVELPVTVMPPADTVRPCAWVTAPLEATENLLVGLLPDCKSNRLPDGDALVLTAKMTALPAPGLPAVVTFKALPVLVPLSKLRTPEATAELLLVKP